MTCVGPLPGSALIKCALSVPVITGDNESGQPVRTTNRAVIGRVDAPRVMSPPLQGYFERGGEGGSSRRGSLIYLF